jgi:hypothetical protein
MMAVSGSGSGALRPRPRAPPRRAGGSFLTSVKAPSIEVGGGGPSCGASCGTAGVVSRLGPGSAAGAPAAPPPMMMGEPAGARGAAAAGGPPGA